MVGHFGTPESLCPQGFFDNFARPALLDDDGEKSADGEPQEQWQGLSSWPL